MLHHSLVEFKDLRIHNGLKVAAKNQSIQNTEAQLREFMVRVGMRKQFIEFNMENPEADSKKGRPSNSALFLMNETKLDICIKENHYRLERDEEAFIKSLRANMGNQAKMNQYINTKGDGGEKNLDDMIKKKKIPTNHMNPKTLFDDLVDFHEQLRIAHGAPNGEYRDFELVINETLILAGSMRLIHNEFTKMPRGQVNIKVDQVTAFKKDQFTPFKDLVFLFTKDVSRIGETLEYKITEEDIEADRDTLIKYDTFHYDDFIQLEVFHKGSVQKNAKLGKAFINLRDLNCRDAAAVAEADLHKSVSSKTFIKVPITFKPSNYGERRLRVNGQIFLSVEYFPRPTEIFWFDWRNDIYNISASTEEHIDRYEHLNDFLSNEFTE